MGRFLTDHPSIVHVYFEMLATVDIYLSLSIHSRCSAAHMFRPPVTLIVCPEIYELKGEAIDKTALAASVAVPGLRRGMS